MIKNWEVFNEIENPEIQIAMMRHNHQIEMNNLKIEAEKRRRGIENRVTREGNFEKYGYTEDDLKMVEEIRNSNNIKDEYGFELDFDRFDTYGLPFIDIRDVDKRRLIAIYHIRDRRFALFELDRLENRTHFLNWNYISSNGNWMSKNMKIDSGYLYIFGSFFEEIERLYYIYYQ